MSAWRSYLRKVLEWSQCIEPTQVTALILPDHPQPDKLLNKVIHIVGEKGFQKWAYLICPCGCKATIMLSLSKTKHPAWAVSFDILQRPTVTPSIWQTSGCYSHFWVKRGKIEWCANTGKPIRSEKEKRGYSTCI